MMSNAGSCSSLLKYGTVLSQRKFGRRSTDMWKRKNPPFRNTKRNCWWTRLTKVLIESQNRSMRHMRRWHGFLRPIERRGINDLGGRRPEISKENHLDRRKSDDSR